MKVTSAVISNSLVIFFINIFEPHGCTIGFAFKFVSFSFSTSQNITISKNEAILEYW